MHKPMATPVNTYPGVNRSLYIACLQDLRRVKCEKLEAARLKAQQSRFKRVRLFFKKYTPGTL